MLGRPRTARGLGFTSRPQQRRIAGRDYSQHANSQFSAATGSLTGMMYQVFGQAATLQ
jgi:hypothetical protein